MRRLRFKIGDNLLKDFHSKFPKTCESPIQLRQLNITDNVYPRDDMDTKYFHGKLRLQETIHVQLRRSQRKPISRTPGRIELFFDRSAHSNGCPCPSHFRRLFEVFYIPLMGYEPALTSIIPKTVSNLKRRIILHQLCEQKVLFSNLTSLSLSLSHR